MRALHTDVSRAIAGGMAPVTSVFVGGGTPSLVAPADLLGVLSLLPLAPGAEVTVECNPDTVTPELAEAYVAGGVNRVSLGVQSMVGSVLASLGRTHDAAHISEAVGAFRAAGIGSLNLDVIYGAAGESLDDWRRTLEGILALEPDHVSAYALTVEAGTGLAQDPARHPDDDDQADKYLMAHEVLGAAGLECYEISNWARVSAPGRRGQADHRCAHNLLYWSQGDYLGFGCAAHSHVSGRRWWNVRTPDRYIDLVEAGGSVEAGHESLDPGARRVEGLQLALRTSSGVPSSALPSADVEELGDLLERTDDDRLILTVPGRLLANEVAVRLR